MYVVTWLIVVSSCVVMAWSVYFAIRDRAVILRQLWAGAVVEGLLLIQLVAGIIAANMGAEPNSLATWVGYGAVALLLPLGAAAMAFVERTRFSSVIMSIVMLVIIIMQWRMAQEWGLL